MSGTEGRRPLSPRTWKDSRDAGFGGWLVLEGVPGLHWAPYQPYTSRTYPIPRNERPAPSSMYQRRVLLKDGGLLDLKLSEDPIISFTDAQDHGVAKGRLYPEEKKGHRTPSRKSTRRRPRP
jgi:hypothetical protein